MKILLCLDYAKAAVEKCTENFFKMFWKPRNDQNKLGLSWAKLKFSLVRVVDEVRVIFNSVDAEIEVIVEISLLVLEGG